MVGLSNSGLEPQDSRLVKGWGFKPWRYHCWEEFIIYCFCPKKELVSCLVIDVGTSCVIKKKKKKKRESVSYYQY